MSRIEQLEEQVRLLQDKIRQLKEEKENQESLAPFSASDFKIVEAADGVDIYFKEVYIVNFDRETRTLYRYLMNDEDRACFKADDQNRIALYECQ